MLEHECSRPPFDRQGGEREDDFQPGHKYWFSGENLNAFVVAVEASISAYRSAVVMLTLYAVTLVVALAVLTDAATTIIAGSVLVFIGIGIILDGRKAGLLLLTPPTTKKDT